MVKLLALFLQNEARKSFELSKFGFLKDGFLRVEVSKMVYNDEVKSLHRNELSNNVSIGQSCCCCCCQSLLSKALVK